MHAEVDVTPADETGAARIEWIAERERLEEIAPAWEGIADSEPLPFARHAWIAAWLSAFASGRELAVAALWRGDALAGVLPLIADDHGLRATANDETPAFVPLARDGAAHAALVCAAAQRGHRELTFPALPAGVALERIEHDLAGCGFVSDSRGFRNSPIVETTGSFEDWRRETKPRWRVQLDRLRRKAAREHELEIVLLREPERLDEELERGLAVEAGGWKGAQRTAVTAVAPVSAFYHELARRFHRLGELRMNWMALDGELVAFDLCLLHGNRLWLLKTGHDGNARRLAPGLVLHLAAIERCFEEGLDAFELLGDDEEWKQKFATAARETRVLRAVPRSSPRAVPVAFRRYTHPFLRRAKHTLIHPDPRGRRS